jgi:hypothetical protein
MYIVLVGQHEIAKFKGAQNGMHGGLMQWAHLWAEGNTH